MSWFLIGMMTMRNAVIFLTILAFSFSVVSYFTYIAKAERERNEYFREQELAQTKGEPVFAGPYCTPDRHPTVLLLIVALTGIAAACAGLLKKAGWSMLLNLAAFAVFGYWYMDTQRAIVGNETAVLSGLDRYLWQANFFDIVTLVMLAVILAIHLAIFAGKTSRILKTRRPLP